MSDPAQRVVPGAGGLNGTAKRKRQPPRSPCPACPQCPLQPAHLPNAGWPFRRQVPNTMLGCKLCTKSFFSLTVGSMII